MKCSRRPSWQLGSILGVVILTIVGCGNEGDSSTTNSGANSSVATASLPDGLFLAGAPGDARSIPSLKQSAKEGDKVIIRAVVGGRLNPLVPGRAAATIVDAQLNNTCVSDDDHCKTPWDYCCEPSEQVTENLATLQIVDESGRVIPADLSSHFQPLSTLVIRGVVGPRPNEQVLTINATGIHVETVMQ